MMLKGKIHATQNYTNVCAEIEGFDFQDCDDRDVAELRRLWLEYGVLRFKRTRISDADQVRFSRHFGDFVIHPKQLQEGGHPTHPEILVISNLMKDGKPAATRQ